MAQTLAKTYGFLDWWEQVPAEQSEAFDKSHNDGNTERVDDSNKVLVEDGQGKETQQEGERGWMLRKGDLDMKIEVQGKNLSYEEDRARVMFLERQSKLLG